ncbi:MAG: hypothetical protein KC619_19880 [Myxococcales bacterium]|nr:hypothetical protein [Myxococcales bacterium]
MRITALMALLGACGSTGVGAPARDGRSDTCVALDVDERVEPVGLFSRVGGLAIDASGVVHVVYLRGSERAHVGETAIRYGRRDTEGRWTLETLAAGPAVEARTSELGDSPRCALALGPDGSVHVAFMALSSEGGGLRYARRRDGDGWSTEWIDERPGAGLEPSLVVDADGTSHVAFTRYPLPPDDFHGASAEWVTYARRSSHGRWAIEQVSERYAGEPRLAVDGSTVRVSLVERDLTRELDRQEPRVVMARAPDGSWRTVSDGERLRDVRRGRTVDAFGGTHRLFRTEPERRGDGNVVGWLRYQAVRRCDPR